MPEGEPGSAWRKLPPKEQHEHEPSGGVYLSLQWIEQAPVERGVDALDDYLNETLAEEVERNGKDREQFAASMQLRPASPESVADWVERVHHGLYELALVRASQFRLANKPKGEPKTGFDEWAAKAERARPWHRTPEYQYGRLMAMRKMLEVFGLKDEAYTIDYLFDQAEAVDTSGSVIDGTAKKLDAPK